MTTTQIETKPMPAQAILPKLTPDFYLSKGFHSESGEPRPELIGLFATAAATQLLRTEASPRVLQRVHEAMQQVLARHDEPASERIRLVVEEAIESTARATSNPVGPGIGHWLRDCARWVETEADIEAFGNHIAAVLYQYGALSTFLASSARAAEAS